MTTGPERFHEVPEPNEAEVAEQTIQYLTGVIKSRYLTGLTHRDVHVKGHAAVQAEFIVEPDLPEKYRVGVFSAPKTFPAWIRVSSAFQGARADFIKDIRGFAIKLMDVPGEKLLEAEKHATTQDFLFLSTNVFLTKNATEFLKFSQTGVLYPETTLLQKLKIGAFFLSHPRVVWSLLGGNKRFANLLEMDWFSATPYLLGDRAVKYALRPRRLPQTKLPKRPAPQNYLRDRLVADLKDEDAFFDFGIQFQLDPKKQPIEDALVAWNTSFRKVATVRLPAQSIDWPENFDFCENLSMNAWHSLPEHRPLGGANRVRRQVYIAISNYRHGQNRVPPAEPEAGETPAEYLRRVRCEKR